MLSEITPGRPDGGSRTRNLIGFVVATVLLVASALLWAPTMQRWDDHIGLTAWILYTGFALVPLVVCVALAITVMRPILPANHDQHVVTMSAAAASVGDIGAVLGDRGVARTEQVTTRLDSVSTRCPTCNVDVVGLPGSEAECPSCSGVRRLPPIELAPVGSEIAMECELCGSWFRGEPGAVVSCAGCGATKPLPAA